MIDCNPALAHHLFKMAQAQRLRHVPPGAHQDHVERVVQALDHLCRDRIQFLFHRSKRSPSRCQHSSSAYREKTVDSPAGACDAPGCSRTMHARTMSSKRSAISSISDADEMKGGANSTWLPSTPSAVAEPG